MEAEGEATDGKKLIIANVGMPLITARKRCGVVSSPRYFVLAAPLVGTTEFVSRLWRSWRVPKVRVCVGIGQLLEQLPTESPAADTGEAEHRRAG